MVQAGDKVSLINDQQRGTVQILHTDGTCTVETGDGFLLRVHVNELVPDRDFLAQAQPVPERKSAAPVMQEPPLDMIPEGNAAFLLLPEYGKVTGGELKLYVLNRSRSSLLLSLYRGSTSDQRGLAAIIASPDSVTSVHTTNRAATNGLFLDFYVNALLHRESPSFLSGRISRQIELPLPGLKENFKEYPSPFSFASYEIFYTEPIPGEDFLSEALQQLKDSFSKSDSKAKPTKTIPSTVNRNSDSVIDLHIEELIDDPATLLPAEILPYQLTCLQQALDEGMKRGAYNLVVIHGLGTGRLRDMVRKELSARRLKFRDAEYGRFGAGATEVLF